MSSFLELRNGSFYLFESTTPSMLVPDGKRILAMMDDISFVIRIWDGGVALVRVGSREQLAPWVKKPSNRDMGMRIVTFPKDFPLDEIEKCRSNSSYLEPLLRRVFPEALDMNLLPSESV